MYYVVYKFKTRHVPNIRLSYRNREDNGDISLVLRISLDKNRTAGAKFLVLHIYKSRSTHAICY